MPPFLIPMKVDPVKPVTPPGIGSIYTVLGMLTWAVGIAALAGILITAIQMAIQHRRNEGGEHMAKLGWIMLACVLGGAAAAIVNLLLP